MPKTHEAANVIVDPRAFLQSLPSSSPLWALTDCFEAVTNGMTSPEAAARLADIDEEAFIPWKILIEAIRCLYEEDVAGLESAIERLPDNSPPAVLRPLFSTWAALPEKPESHPLANCRNSVADLYQRLFASAHPLGALAEQAEEALRQGMTAHFQTLALKVLAALYENSRIDGFVFALRYLERCRLLLEQCHESPDGFTDEAIKILGASDGALALALSLVGKNDALALFAFRRARDFASAKTSPNHAMYDILAATVEILEKPHSSAFKKTPAVRGSRPKPASACQLELFPVEAV